MATSSILKDFYVVDEAAYERFERMINDADSIPDAGVTNKPLEWDGLEEGRKALATFRSRVSV